MQAGLELLFISHLCLQLCMDSDMAGKKLLSQNLLLWISAEGIVITTFF